MNEATNIELEVLPPSALEVLQKAEIDVQIATAKKYPRSIELFKKGAVEMATLDDDTATSCIYRRPVGKENGKPVYAEGMSVRMAEIVGACYGNIRVYATVIEQTPRQVRVRGMAIDLERNFASSSEVVEPTVKRDGSPYDERMSAVIVKAALAKARRDATFQVVPRALAKPVEAAVRKLLIGDAKSLEQRRSAVVAWVDKLSIDNARVWAALGVQGPADLTTEHLETLTGLRTAIKDGDTSIDEAFPPILATAKVGQPSTDKPKSVTEAAQREKRAKSQSKPVEPAQPVKEGEQSRSDHAQRAEDATNTASARTGNAAPTSEPEGAATPEPEMPHDKGEPQRQAVAGNGEGKVPTAAPVSEPTVAGGESAPPAKPEPSLILQDHAAEKLRAEILKRAKDELSCGKTVLVMNLQELGWLNEGESFDSIDLATATGILERWDVLAKKVKGGAK